MSSSTDVATRYMYPVRCLNWDLTLNVRVQAYLNLPLIQRCKKLAILIEESSTTELQHVFPILIESIFGIKDNVGWGLHQLTFERCPQEYEVLCHFLGPMGPIFFICYKLLPDCYLKYNFPFSFLPVKIKSMIEEGSTPPFYFDKLKDEHGPTKVPQALAMNPFEYYIFHFAYHLTNPWLQLQQQENVWMNWETIYVQLAHNYLVHFLPKDNSPVSPVIGPYVKKTPPRKLMQTPESKRLQTPRLLRTSILFPAASSPAGTVIPQQQCLSQVWRSETIVQVFLDFWLEYTEESQFSNVLGSPMTGILPRRHSIHSGEHIRLVRAFIKTLHEFANSSIGDQSAMDELKKMLLPSVQGKIYTFLKKAIQHWPLDSSFRLILEAWLSFIQPWRYSPGFVLKENGSIEEEERGKIHDPNKWISFVASNLLAYTAIFQQILLRFTRTDLVAPKNALMLFRVTKVFSQPYLAKMLMEIESCMDDVMLSRGRSTNQWAATVRQKIVEIENAQYQYVPMFATQNVNQVTWFLSTIKQAHLTATSLIDAIEKRRNKRKFLLSVWEFFNGEDISNDEIGLEERKRVPIYLANTQQQLIDIFDIKLEDIPQVAIVADQEYHDSILSTSFCHQSQSQLDISLDSSRPGVYLPLQDGRQNCRYIEYLGDPELQPIRSYEIGFLVRFFYRCCEYLNGKYQTDLINLYERNDFLGRIVRQIVSPPTTIVKLPKRTFDGLSSGSETQLPPRLSLRPIATYNFFVVIFMLKFFFWVFGYGNFAFAAFLFIVYTIYVISKATCEPWTRPIVRDLR